MTKRKLWNYGPALMALTMIGLTGCASESPVGLPSSAIYQPRILALPAGTPVQTQAGIYTPTRDEVWHSPAAFAAVESELLDAVGVIQQLRGVGKN